MIRTTEIAPGLAIAAQIKADDVAALAEQGVRTIINNRPDGEEASQAPAAVVGDEAKKHGVAYIYLPVTTATISTADVAAFDRALEESAKPIVAHCRSGSRTYHLWAAAEALNRKVDPAALVSEAAAKGFDLKALPDIVARLKRG